MNRYAGAPVKLTHTDMSDETAVINEQYVQVDLSSPKKIGEKRGQKTKDIIFMILPDHISYDFKIARGVYTGDHNVPIPLRQ